MLADMIQRIDELFDKAAQSEPPRPAYYGGAPRLVR